MDKKRVLIDTDPNSSVPHKDIDDCLAILLLLASQEITIEGITINFGNVDAQMGYKACCEMLEVAKKDIPVFKGAQKRSDLGRHTPAVDFLIEKVRKNPGEITLLALAPLTNVASAMMLDPTFSQNLKELVFMGGTQKFFGFNFFGEFNFHLGGAATQIVLSSPVKKTVIPMELCAQALFTNENLEPFRRNPGSPISRYIVRTVDSWLKSWVRVLLFKKEGFYPWDVVAAAYLIDETLFDNNPVTFSARIDGIRSGSVYDFNERSSFEIINNIVPMNMPKKLDVERFMKLFVERLLTL